MNGLGSSVEISDEERRRRLGRVYSILLDAAERRRVSWRNKTLRRRHQALTEVKMTHK